MWLVLFVLPLVNAQCYWNNKNPYTYFGSKTPYDAVRGDFRDVPTIKRCEPVSVWFMTRHGVREPSEEDTALMLQTLPFKEEILKSYEEGRGELCAQDIANLRDWQWDDNLNNATSQLTSEGYQELLEFGDRFGEKFSDFLGHVDRYLVRSSIEQRTQESAKAFIQALEKINVSFPIEDPILDDPIVRPYRYCKKRGYEVINSTRMFHELDRFQHTKEFKLMLENVQKRIGLVHELTPDNVIGFYELCRYYRSYSVLKTSPWCALLSDEELRVLEYVEDIKYYFRNGYGHSMNLLLGAAGLKDLFYTFEQTQKDDRKYFKGFFTHDTMIDMIYTAMGLYRDYPEISGFERLEDRKWRSSFLTPFAANFVAVLHRCTKSMKHHHKVQFFINEKEFHLCGDHTCSWEHFQNKFKDFTEVTLDFCNEPEYTTTLL